MIKKKIVFAIAGNELLKMKVDFKNENVEVIESHEDETLDQILPEESRTFEGLNKFFDGKAGEHFSLHNYLETIQDHGYFDNKNLNLTIKVVEVGEAA